MANVVIPAGTIPSASTLANQIYSDLTNALGQNIPQLAKAFFWILSISLGGLQHLAYRFGAWCLNQIFPQTADLPQLVLIGGRLNPPVIPNQAVAWQGAANATGNNGISLPAGTNWSYGGFLYQQNTTVVISGGVAALALTCLTPGSAGTLGNGVVLQIASPIAGADGTATVTSTSTVGTDAELVGPFRLRVQAAQATPPQGGAAADYINQALASGQGIVKAWAYRIAPGFVSIYPLPAPGNATVLPNSGQLTGVFNYMNDTRRRNLNANVLVTAPTVRTLNLTLSGMGMTAAQQAQAASDITAYLLAAFPRQYPDQANPTDWITALAIAGICQADGATGGTVAMTVVGMGVVTQYQLGGGFSANTGCELIQLGTITWS